MDDYEENKQISKYNDAFYSISRLHESYLRCKSHIRNGNLKGLRYELDIIWLELYSDVLRNEDKKNIVKRNNDIMKKISQSKNRSQLFFNLMGRYEFLREIQDSAGKGNVYVDKDEEGFE